MQIESSPKLHPSVLAQNQQSSITKTRMPSIMAKLRGEGKNTAEESSIERKKESKLMPQISIGKNAVMSPRMSTLRSELQAERGNSFSEESADFSPKSFSKPFRHPSQSMEKQPQLTRGSTKGANFLKAFLDLVDKKNKEEIEGQPKKPIEEKIKEKLLGYNNRSSRRLSFDRIKSFHNYLPHNNVENVLGRKKDLSKKSRFVKHKDRSPNNFNKTSQFT